MSVPEININLGSRDAKQYHSDHTTHFNIFEGGVDSWLGVHSDVVYHGGQRGEFQQDLHWKLGYKAFLSGSLRKSCFSSLWPVS